MDHLNTTTATNKTTKQYHMDCDLSRIIITEIYASVQGESSFAGKPCTFVRLTGCPLRCRWCDTVYGFAGGKELAVADVMAEVARLGVSLVEITGGEPLAQPGAVALMQRLIADGYQVLLETSGSESVAQVPADVHIIMDIKCPGSGMSERNDLGNLDYLKPSDEIKFVVANKFDFDWAAALIRERCLTKRFQVLISPAFGLLKPAELVEWILAEPLSEVRLNLQLHKYIWSPRAKGV